MVDPVFWHLDDLLDGDPEDKVQRIIEEDHENESQALRSLGPWFEIYDACLELFISVFKDVYSPSVKEGWMEDEQKRTVVALLVAVANYFFLLRHSLAMGYYPESHGLIRDVYERTSRALLFFHSRDWSEKFLNGQRIKQVQVDKALASIYGRHEVEGDAEEVLNSFRKYYRLRSGYSHANLEGLGWRTPGLDPEQLDKDRLGELRRRVGRDILIGGINGAQIGKTVMIDAAYQLLDAISVLRMVLNEHSGELAKRYQNLRSRIEVMINDANSELD